MALFDDIKGMAKAAQKALADHPDQVHQALAKLETVVDTQTGGTHHDQIAKAGSKAEQYLDKQAHHAP